MTNPDKINTEAGEQPPGLVRRTTNGLRNSLTGAAAASLRTGSGILTRRAWALIAPGAPLYERLAYIGAGGYALTYGATHAPEPAAPFIAPAAALGWCVAAWLVAPPVEEEQEEDPPPTPVGGLVPWLLHTIGDRPGIHLYELYPAMRTIPGHEGRTDTQLRAALRTLGIPVQRSLRVGRVEGRSGVRRSDLPPLPSPHGDRPGESGGDAGQGQDSPLVSGVGEGMESTP